MDTILNALKSKTVWAALLGFAATLFQAFGVKLLDGVDVQALAAQLTAAAQGIAFLLAIVFRVNATTIIKPA